MFQQQRKLYSNKDKSQCLANPHLKRAKTTKDEKTALHSVTEWSESMTFECGQVDTKFRFLTRTSIPEYKWPDFFKHV